MQTLPSSRSFQNEHTKPRSVLSSVDSSVKNARWGAYHIQRARKCFSCTLYLTTVSVLLTFLLGRSPGKVHKRMCTRASATTKTIQITFFHPCSIALHLVLGRLLLNTWLKKAVGACTIVCDTDLQGGRAMTSLFCDVTIELYTCFQSLLPLYNPCLYHCVGMRMYYNVILFEYMVSA